MSLPNMEEDDNDDNALKLLDEPVSKITELQVAKKRYKDLHEDRRRKVDYYMRLERKAQSLDKALAKERDEVESLKRTLELEQQKDEADAESRRLERDQKTERQEGRIRDYLSDVLYRKPPPPKRRKKKDQLYELETVLISFTRPKDNIRYNLPFRVDKTTTLLNLRNDACAYWDVDNENFILKTMANSKCENDILVQDCFKRGEIAQLRLEGKNKEQTKITEAEEKAIQPRKNVRGGKAQKADMVDSVLKFNDRFRTQMQKMGGIYFLLKLRDLKPSEHVAKIKLRDFFVYFALAIITIICYSYQRNSGEHYWFLEGIESAIMESVPRSCAPSCTAGKSNYVPSFADLETHDDVYDFLEITIPHVIWSNDTATVQNLHKYNMLVGYLNIRQKLVRTPNPAWEHCNSKYSSFVASLNASCPAASVDSDTERTTELGPFFTHNVTAGNQSNFTNGSNTTTTTTTTQRSYIDLYWAEVLDYHRNADYIRGPALPHKYVSNNRNSDDHHIAFVHGQLQTYSTGGYSVEYKMSGIPERLYDENVQYYRDDMAKFRQLGWLDPLYSRVLFIDFSVYNYNYDIWGAVEMIIEFPPSGHALTQLNLRPFQPNLFETSHDYVVMYIMSFRILIAIYILFGVGCAEIKHKTKNQNAGIAYYLSLNGFCDVGMVACIIASMTVRFISFSTDKTGKLLEKLQDDTKSVGFHNWTDTAIIYEWLYVLEGFIFFLNMLRLISLFRLSRNVYLLWHTVGIAIRQAAYLCTVFVPTYFFFMITGQRIWGASHPEFRTLASSFMAVFHMLKGEVDVEPMITSAAASAAIFYAGLYIFVTFLLFAGFAMVFAESYYVVQLTVANQSGSWGFTEWKRWFVSPVLLSLMSFAVNPGSPSQKDTTT